MRDRIVAIASPRTTSRHTQRHLVSNFRLSPPPTRAARAGELEILRTFPGKRSEHFVSGSYDDRIAIAAASAFQEKLCVLDSDVAPDALIYPI